MQGPQTEFSLEKRVGFFMDAGRQNLQLSPQCRCLTRCVGAAEVCTGARERATSIPAMRWGARGWRSRAAGAVTPLQAPGHRPGEPPLCRAGPEKALSHTRSEKNIPEDTQLGAACRWTGVRGGEPLGLRSVGSASCQNAFVSLPGPVGGRQGGSRTVCSQRSGEAARPQGR